MERYKVSIVIPFYNSQRYLRDCLESVINQTYRNLQIICVDDGSTDDGCDIVREYMQNDGRIVLLSQQHANAGAARNFGMEDADGDYIIFLDADDFFELTMIAVMVDKAAGEGADLVVCNSIGFNENTGKKYEITGCSLFMDALPVGKDTFTPEEISNSIFQMTAGWPWDKLIKRTLIERNKLQFQNLRVSNDALFVNLVCVLAKKIAVVKNILVTHRSHVTTSIEYSKTEHWECVVTMLRSFEKELKNRGIFEQYKNSFISFAAGSFVAYVTTAVRERDYLDLLSICKEVMLCEFHVGDYEKNDFFDKKIYGTLFHILQDTPIEFLLKQTGVLSEVLQEQHEILQEQQEVIQEQEKVIKSFDAALHDLTKKQQLMRWHFSEEDYPAHGKYIIYGYGKVGRDLARQLVNSRYSELVGVVDANWEKYKDESICFADDDARDIRICSPKMIEGIDYDYILISVRKADFANEIYERLIDNGVEKEKIICPFRMDLKNEKI